MPGPDIFLSYNREDSDRAKQFAEGFAAQGLEVWWDVALRSGEAYDKVTEDALRNAKAVVVLWSPRSVDSRWVRAEATLADRKKTLVPAMIEPCERPIMFELVQTADLSHWQGDTADKGWTGFVADVCNFIGQAPAAAPAVADAALPGLDQLSVVVLPFANMSGDPEQEYFADGITEDIITDLSQVSALRVISRNSSFTFKGKHVDVAALSRQLNVTHILEGSVRKVGNRVRVTAQLIDGADNDHVWAQRFDRDLDDIFALQDELSKAIVGALRLKLLPEEKKAIEARGTDSVEAYDLYLRATNKFGGMKLDEAAAFANAAVAIDPLFSVAWELIAIIQLHRGLSAPTDAEKYFSLCEEAFEKVAEIAPGSPKAIAAKATRMFAVERDWLGAERTFALAERTLTIGPMGPNRAFLLGAVGRVDEAIDVFRECLRSDPLVTAPVFGSLLDCAGRFEDAMAETERMRRLGAHTPLIEYFALLRCMARDDTATIRAQFERYLAADDTYMPIHRTILANLDNKPAIAAILHNALEDDFYQSTSQLNGLSQMAGFCGDDAFALECLRRASVSLRGAMHIAIWHPLLAGVRKLEGFKQLMRDIGFAEYWQTTGEWGDFARPVGDDDFEMVA